MAKKARKATALSTLRNIRDLSDTQCGDLVNKLGDIFAEIHECGEEAIAGVPMGNGLDRCERLVRATQAAAQYPRGSGKRDMAYVFVCMMMNKLSNTPGTTESMTIEALGIERAVARGRTKKTDDVTKQRLVEIHRRRGAGETWPEIDAAMGLPTQYARKLADYHSEKGRRRRQAKNFRKHV